MPTILTGCAQCNAGNKVSEQMEEIKQKRTAGKIVGSYTEEPDGIRFTLNGVEFKMITVEGGSFTMDQYTLLPAGLTQQPTLVIDDVK